MLPMTPPSSPYVPSSDTCHIDLWSEATSPLRGEIEAAGKLIFNDDAIKPRSQNVAQRYGSMV